MSKFVRFMKVRTHITKVMCFLFCTILLNCNTLQAQSSKEETQAKKEVLLQGIDRWSFKTNVLDWLLTVPNAGVEFDLSSSPYNRSTLGVSGRYNWNTWHKFVPPTVFNMWDVKPEYRYYWRPRPKGPRSGRTAISALIEKDNPKEWRAYWLGLYASYGGYGMKFTDTGWQGTQASAGLTFGYGTPLYNWGKKGTIDMEVGVSVGCMFTENEQFTHNIDGNFYSYVEGSHKEWHIMPFPVMSEIRVALAYRTRSIKDKYSRIDQSKIRERQEKEYQEQLEQEAAAEAKAIAELEKAEAKAAKEKAKADAKAAKEQARIDWENMTKEERKEAAKKQKAEKKEAKAKAKEEKKLAKEEKKSGKTEDDQIEGSQTEEDQTADNPDKKQKSKKKKTEKNKDSKKAEKKQKPEKEQKAEKEKAKKEKKKKAEPETIDE